jgi:WD40 repeat protein
VARKKADQNQAAAQPPGAGGVENTPNVQADHDSVAIGGFSIGRDLTGEINIASGDIIKNVKTIHQRALTAAEKAARARQLESNLLAQGIAALVQNLSAQASEGIESDSPYKGLLPYGLNEAEIFHGRDKAKKDLLAHIRQNPLTVLHAESGAGKSSLLQAGIAAQLIANGHLAVYLRPRDADPVDFIKRMFLPELTQAPAVAKAPLREFLRQVGGVLGSKTTLYLLLDQFEEFFNLLDKNEREPFLESLEDCLSDPSLKVRWVLALRAEALSKLDELESVGIAPFKNMYSLHHLSRAEAQEAIIEPARRHGIVFEPALIEHILDTLLTNGEVTPTHLQLVCSALTDDLPTDQTLTLTYYIDHEGDTEGILGDYLKRQLEYLPATEQATAWKVLRALITADRLRALKTHDELVQELNLSGISKEQIDLVLARLLERRLLATQPATIETFELAHDYLVKEIELDPQEQARKAAQELLDQETRTYKRHRTLLSAERLAVIEPYRNELSVSADAQALLIESRMAVLEEQRVSERTRRRTITSLATGLVIMLILAIFAGVQYRRAEEQAQIALARQLAAQSQNLTLDRASYVQGGLLAVEAGIRRGIDEPEIHKALINYLRVSSTEVGRMNYDSWVSAVAFSADGEYVASGSADGTARVWQAATGHELSRLSDEGGVSSIAFSPDNKSVVAGWANGIVKVWEAATGREIAHMTFNDSVLSVAFRPDDKYIVSGSNPAAQVWEAATGKEVAHINHDAWVHSVAFSSDGEQVVSGGADGTVRVWDTTSGQEIARMKHDGAVYSVAFSPDDQYVASGSGDGTVRIWEAATGKEIAVMQPYGIVFSVAFSPDGQFVVSGSESGRAQVWIAGRLSEGEDREKARMNHGFPVYSVAFSPTGGYVVSGGADGTARLWDAMTGEQVAGLFNHGIVFAVAFSPDGKYIVSGGCDDLIGVNTCPGSARVWEASTGPEIAGMTLGKLMDEACKRLGRNLTEEEWKQYFPGEKYRITCRPWPPGK